MNRTELSKSFNKVAQTLEESTDGARKMLESLQQDGKLLTAPRRNNMQSSKFIKVNVWSFDSFFLGKVSICTRECVTVDDVMLYIERHTPYGSGNYKKESLMVKTIKVKSKNVVFAI